ncbi:hypothetical protein COW36_15695, partial [bacterium (Candidatus Blackallbacteria) CG17_big_fil_post_rev_8_21_14_2_50_48_46]
IWPMVDLGQFFIKGRTAGVSVERVREMEAFPPDILPQADALPFPTGKFALSFENIDYQFATGQGLAKISLATHSGETLALAGPVGSGKTLLLNLIPRIIQPQTGKLLLNGQELSRYDLQELRQKVGYVSQIPSLFSETIANNIRFGREISPQKLQAAIQVAQLEQDLALFPEGLETRVGQHGVRLSGGQKQRIAIARALAGSPRILILDDCTSALDAETESRLWQSLYRLMPDLMVLLVTHRVSTLQRADRVVLLSQGKIRAQGSHLNLLASDKLYQEIYGQPDVFIDEA